MLTKITKSILGIALIASVASFSGCKKYDAGSDISIYSAKKRVANNWEVELFMENGYVKTWTVQSGYLLKLGTGGKTILKRSETSAEVNGTWKLEADEDGKKDQYLHIMLDDNTDVKYKIIKLEKKKLWLKSKELVNNVPTYNEWHFNAQE